MMGLAIITIINITTIQWQTESEPIFPLLKGGNYPARHDRVLVMARQKFGFFSQSLQHPHVRPIWRLTPRLVVGTG
jgi:hypothetical protein